MRFRLHTPLLLGALILAGSACTLSGTEQAEPVQSFVDPQTNATWVSGYVWDPEAYFFAFATCTNPPAPAPSICDPLLIPGLPVFESSVASGSMVALFDPTAPDPTAPPAFMTTAPSDTEGFWEIGDVASRPGPPFFALTFPGKSAAGALHSGGAGISVPPADFYIPTLTLQPIFTANSQCQSEPAVQLSDNGILEAVADWLTSTGSKTVTVQDLLDATQYGGVGVVWLYAPTSGPLMLPAFGTEISATSTADGSPLPVLNINWAPPGFGPPPDAQGHPLQSARGFFVDPTTGPVAPLGLAVIVMPGGPPGPPTPVALTFQDTSNDASASPPHPYIYPPIPPQVFAPGTLSFLNLPAIDTQSKLPSPPWLCLSPPPGAPTGP